MLAAPHTLSLITTHQCTAACEHCCFSCTPAVTDRIPFERMKGLIDEAANIPSMRVVVFTGGECYLLGKELDELIRRADGHGLITRTVTNGYWATSAGAARERVARVVGAGLKEINISTGTFHAEHVPVDRVIHGALASVEAGLTTLINIEIFNESTFNVDTITMHPRISALVEANRLLIQRNVWIKNAGLVQLSHKREHSRFNDNTKSGCTTALGVLAVTPSQSLVACCGLHLEKIPDLHLGSIADRTIGEVLDGSPDDFLKIWIHVEGPERILEFVKKHLPSYRLPTQSVHPCETCLHLFRDETAKTILSQHYKERQEEVVSAYMAGLLGFSLSRQLRDRAGQAIATSSDDQRR